MTEDLSVFFDVTEHATRAVLDNVEVAGIFDNGYGRELGVVGVLEPAFTLPSAQCTRVHEGSSLRIVDGAHAGRRYVVTTPEPDGTGVTVLRLQKA
jgi:hypothetical protein